MNGKPHISLFSSKPINASIKWYCSVSRDWGFGYGKTPKEAFEKFEASHRRHLAEFGAYGSGEKP